MKKIKIHFFSGWGKVNSDEDDPGILSRCAASENSFSSHRSSHRSLHRFREYFLEQRNEMGSENPFSVTIGCSCWLGLGLIWIV